MGGYVELFAGCGGLSLGLEAAGHHRRLANELSPMAAESYAFNLLGTDLSSDEPLDGPRRVKWLRSHYPHSFDRRRLLEDPTQYGAAPQVDDLPEADLEGSLLVGDVRHLNEFVDRHGPLVQDPDIVSGGPPCQSFSMAGLRDFGNHRNRLPWEFARFVGAHRPKIALLENVSGILRPFTDADQLVYAWFEVAKAFAEIGYAPICLQVNARDVGVAQNRPRYLMIAVRSDLVSRVASRLGPASEVLNLGRELLRSAGRDVRFDSSRHGIVDLTKSDVVHRLAGSPLDYLSRLVSRPVPVSDAIDDLEAGGPVSEYVKELNETFGPHLVRATPRRDGDPLNNERRSHTVRVTSRFALYQALDKLESIGGRADAQLVRAYLKTTGENAPQPSDTVVLKLMEAGFRDAHGRHVASLRQGREALESLKTRKRTQRALRAQQPAPAALSIPDDACHYSALRTLSVREMARIQSFPDDFEFRSLPTTGGPRRRYQVPQYTQIGNAVPPLLGLAIGRVLSELIDERQFDLAEQGESLKDSAQLATARG